MQNKSLTNWFTAIRHIYWLFTFLNWRRTIMTIIMHDHVKVVRHIEMPKAAPKKSICHFQKLEMIQVKAKSYKSKYEER